MRLGKEEKLKLFSVPLKLRFGRLNPIMLPKLLQVIPVQLHGPVLLASTSDQELSDRLEIVDLHWRRASASDSATVSLKESAMARCKIRGKARKEKHLGATMVLLDLSDVVSALLLLIRSEG